MPKTINWTEEFEKEIMEEEVGSVKLALRPGRLYYDTGYYKKGDIVDIRINNNVVRKALIEDDISISTIKGLSQDELKLMKESLQSKDEIVSSLAKRYNVCIDKNFEVTLIKYKNLELESPTENEDPHFG